MKKLIGLGLLLTLSTFANAGIKTRVLHIDAPEIMGETYDVLVAKNKTILKVDPANSTLIKKLYEAEEFNSVVDLEIENDQLISLEIIEGGDKLLDFYPSEELHPMTNYTPSNVDSYEQAVKMFGYLKKRTKWFTQCFNRALVWSKQMYDRDNVKSMKILIYYTKKYRREIDGKWWFHIAPMIDINGQNFVMDREFTNKPITDTQWEKIFTKKMEAKGVFGYRCKVIKNIKEYYNNYNQQNEYCNIQVTSMYYWEPNDMSKLDKTGVQQTKFENWKLKSAAKEVFFGWRKVYREIKD
ncbi:MAG: hypothetical protein ACJAS4_002396 [Bacteriovoracaceae bacterium]|jgi:hypothetical protein